MALSHWNVFATLTIGLMAAACLFCGSAKLSRLRLDAVLIIFTTASAGFHLLTATHLLFFLKIRAGDWATVNPLAAFIEYLPITTGFIGMPVNERIGIFILPVTTLALLIISLFLERRPASSARRPDTDTICPQLR